LDVILSVSILYIHDVVGLLSVGFAATDESDLVAVESDFLVDLSFELHDAMATATKINSAFFMFVISFGEVKIYILFRYTLKKPKKLAKFIF